MAFCMCPPSCSLLFQCDAGPRMPTGLQACPPSWGARILSESSRAPGCLWLPLLRRCYPSTPPSFPHTHTQRATPPPLRSNEVPHSHVLDAIIPAGQCRSSRVGNGPWRTIPDTSLLATENKVPSKTFAALGHLHGAQSQVLRGSGGERSQARPPVPRLQPQCHDCK